MITNVFSRLSGGGRNPVFKIYFKDNFSDWTPASAGGTVPRGIRG